ncbi:MAG: integrase core domain-containing protein [Bacteroidales bacterium]|nr:integrase core domain-containing protein [Bacteroidales bacterium]
MLIFFSASVRSDYKSSYSRRLDCKSSRTGINEAREVTEEWRTFYNNQRPHESLDNQTPMSFRNKKLFEYGYN